jgi:hypothetical protein
MSVWTSGRRFAHLPLLGLAIPIGALVAFRLGEFLRASALNPRHSRCGLGFEIPLTVWAWIGLWVVAVGLGLLISEPTRTVGRRILQWGVPSYAVVSIIGGIVGRYVAW